MNNTYYRRNKERLLKRGEINITMKLVRRKLKNIMKIINKDCQINSEVNIENYLMKERI